ncbi:hypothetical protein LTR64_007543 [Lithohypha guttulata]|uniref:uncharacterized protein n=1 Tax=Lithohypha guttulata TaxID=1690604 RepID=UPI002DE03E55|nr:hypothetical protein LTR51_007053 [Lithohypha guttulata]
MSLPSDSGYGSSSLQGRRAKPTQLQDTYQHHRSIDPYNHGVPGQFSAYRDDAQSSVSGLNTMPEEDDLLLLMMTHTEEDAIDPTTLDSTSQLMYTTGGMELDSSTPQLRRSNALELSQNHTSTSFNLQMGRLADLDFANFACGDTTMKWSQPLQPQSQLIPSRKRARTDADAQAASHEHIPPVSPYGSCQSQSAQSTWVSRPSRSTPFQTSQASIYPQPDKSNHRQQSSYFDQQSTVIPALQGLQPPSSKGHNKAKTSRKEATHGCSLCPPGKVFRTINDLDRHCKTFHGMLKKGDKIFRCKVPGCKEPNKVWARFDNFKQHVTRMHGTEYESRIEEMEEQYDIDVHGPVEPSKSRKSSQNTSVQATQHLTDQAVGGLALQHRDLPNIGTSSGFVSSNGTLMSTDTSVDNRGSFSLRASSFNGSNNSLNVLRMPSGSPRKPQPHSVANPETCSRQREELQEQNMNFEASAVEPHTAVLRFMDQGAQPLKTNVWTAQTLYDDQSTTRHPTLNLDLAHEEIPQRFSALLECVRNLSADERQHFQQFLRLSVPGASQSGSAKSNKSSRSSTADGDKSLKCNKEGCKKLFSKQSDLHKHQKRHDKKYGCTFDNCYKRFGTKWEWKRHEYGQHVQFEEWRCQYPKFSGDKLCATHFDDKEKFIAHLKAEHKMTAPEAGKNSNECRLAKRWLESYWCGFCNKIIRSETNFGAQMDEERYNHIANHIDTTNSAKHEMDAWIELRGGGKSKEELYEKYKEEKEKQALKSKANSESIETQAQQPTEEEDAPAEDDDLSFGAGNILAMEDDDHAFFRRPDSSSAAPRRRSSTVTNIPGIMVSAAEEPYAEMEMARAYPEQQPQPLSDLRHHMHMHQMDSNRICCHCKQPDAPNRDLSQCTNCTHIFCSGCQLEPFLHPGSQIQDSHFEDMLLSLSGQY